MPFCLEFTDPEMYARGIASAGPSFEAIQNIGEEELLKRATELAASRGSSGRTAARRTRAVRLHRHQADLVHGLFVDATNQAAIHIGTAQLTKPRPVAGQWVQFGR